MFVKSQEKPEMVRLVIDVLFSQELLLLITLTEIREKMSLFDTEEVDATVNRLSGKYWKASGPDESIVLSML